MSPVGYDALANMSMTSYKLLFAALLLWSLGIGLSFQGARGLFETTEGRYAECAREMVASGNYMEPTLDLCRRRNDQLADELRDGAQPSLV